MPCWGCNLSVISSLAINERVASPRRTSIAGANLLIVFFIVLNFVDKLLLDWYYQIVCKNTKKLRYG